jgi:hypothetical protein
MSDKIATRQHHGSYFTPLSNCYPVPADRMVIQAENGLHGAPEKSRLLLP